MHHWCRNNYNYNSPRHLYLHKGLSDLIVFIILLITKTIVTMMEIDQNHHHNHNFHHHVPNDFHWDNGCFYQKRGDILHVISKDDPHWWQAYRLVIFLIFLITIPITIMMVDDRDGEWTQTLAGLIPSLALQQHRLALQRQKREQVILINWSSWWSSSASSWSWLSSSSAS